MGKAQAQEKEQTVDCQEILALHRLSELDFCRRGAHQEER